MFNFENVDFVGVYGALIATAIFIWEIIKVYLNRKKITLHPRAATSEPAEDVYWISLFLTNTSNQNYSVYDIWFISTQKEGYAPLEEFEIKTELKPGSSFEFRFDLQCHTKKSLRRMFMARRIVVHTGDGKAWESSLFPFYYGNILKRYLSYRRFKKRIT